MAVNRINITLETGLGDIRVELPLNGVSGFVELDDYGSHKIQTIKVVREWTGWGLRESKDATERCPTRFYPSDLNGQHTSNDLRVFAMALMEVGADAVVQTTADTSEARVIQTIFKAISDLIVV
jgi:hypothetical protein